jgi:hypothetical protein
LVGFIYNRFSPFLEAEIFQRVSSLRFDPKEDPAIGKRLYSGLNKSIKNCSILIHFAGEQYSNISCEAIKLRNAVLY